MNDTKRTKMRSNEWRFPLNGTTRHIVLAHSRHSCHTLGRIKSGRQTIMNADADNNKLIFYESWYSRWYLNWMISCFQWHWKNTQLFSNVFFFCVRSFRKSLKRILIMMEHLSHWWRAAIWPMPDQWGTCNCSSLGRINMLAMHASVWSHVCVFVYVFISASLFAKETRLFYIYDELLIFFSTIHLIDQQNENRNSRNIELCEWGK